MTVYIVLLKTYLLSNVSHSKYYPMDCFVPVCFSELDFVPVLHARCSTKMTSSPSKIKVTVSALLSIGSTVPLSKQHSLIPSQLIRSSLFASAPPGVYIAMSILGKKQFLHEMVLLLSLNTAKSWSSYDPKSQWLLSQKCWY